KVNIKVVKNKVAPPFKIAQIEIMYGEGISHVSEILDLCVDNEIVNKSGAWFSYQGNKIGQGKEAAKNFLKSNPILLEELEGKLNDILKLYN
ncbi:MAG: DNA recombination/repair protein RecA, partial [Erysipelotrichaceae bacterium]